MTGASGSLLAVANITPELDVAAELDEILADSQFLAFQRVRVEQKGA